MMTFSDIKVMTIKFDSSPDSEFYHLQFILFRIYNFCKLQNVYINDKILSNEIFLMGPFPCLCFFLLYGKSIIGPNNWKGNDGLERLSTRTAKLPWMPLLSMTSAQVIKQPYMSTLVNRHWCG